MNDNQGGCKSQIMPAGYNGLKRHIQSSAYDNVSCKYYIGYFTAT